MLYFMGSSAHLPNGSIGANMNAIIICMVIIAALEVNAVVGKQGPITTVRGVIVCGLAMTLVLWALLKFI
ncbi:MAG: antitermination protein NusG, partial [Pseudomonadota bacterium]